MFVIFGGKTFWREKIILAGTNFLPLPGLWGWLIEITIYVIRIEGICFTKIKLYNLYTSTYTLELLLK